MTRNGLYFKCRITSIIIDNQYTAVLSVQFNNIEKVKYSLFMHTLCDNTVHFKYWYSKSNNFLVWDRVVQNGKI